MAENILSQLDEIEKKLDSTDKLYSYEYAIIQLDLYKYKFRLQRINLQRINAQRKKAIEKGYGYKVHETTEQLEERQALLKKRLAVLALKRQEVFEQSTRLREKINNMIENAAIEIREREKAEKDALLLKYRDTLLGTSI